MNKLHVFVIWSIKTALLWFGFASVWHGIDMIYNPASYIVLGLFCIYLGYPNKIKKVKDVDNR